MIKEKTVRMWEEIVEIPTYPVGEPDKNPMFLEKRVYQGSSGKVYPLPFTDKIYDNKILKEYKMVYLENKYLKIAILPELGGRIQRALDKTNGYDFIYYNQVIKPALVGLTGPWISGGIEINWPQHHRPRTFSPVEYYLEENDDGSKTVWVSEIDRMYGTKGIAGYTLYPDKAYLEIKGQVYNGTPTPQTFLWWANPAVAVNENYKSVFPPDVHAVFDHGKRDVSKFPIATGKYYKVDYSAGVDISMYKNIPVPTSYMAYHSDYDFVGGYDYGKKAGILHVADHHISPGKKQWTWGNGDFGQAWYENLTDEDGPYIELMTGVYTDNQPDFTWLKPYEQKTFRQYFMPYKEIGEVKNATIEALVNLEFNGDKAIVYVYTTSYHQGLEVVLKSNKIEYLREKTNLGPEESYEKKVQVNPELSPYNYLLEVRSADGDILVSYRPEKKERLETPDPAQPAGEPEDIRTNEELYLTGLHLEQYRHATYDPEPYYLEGLKRDPDDIRINNAYGRLLFSRGLFAESEQYFRRSIKRSTWKNPNPYDGEPYYNLGLSLEMQNKTAEAFEAFFKATWDGNWQASGYYALARITCQQGDYKDALEYISKSIVRNYHNTKARNLKAAILRKLKRFNSVEALALETLEIDKLDFGARFELYKAYQALGENEKAEKIKEELRQIMRNSHHNYLETALDYGNAGFYGEAIELLEWFVNEARNYKEVYPMIFYYLGYYYLKLGEEGKGKNYFKLGYQANPLYCFPNRIYSIPVLEKAMEIHPDDPRAPYYLGNLYYDKKQYLKAIKLWEKARELDPEFPTTYRNLALGYYNKLGDSQKAREALERAFNLDKSDSRLLFELDQLYKKLNVDYQERLDFLEKHLEQVKERDDLYIEYVTLYNNLERYEEAREMLLNRKFHPWEGGEGKVTSQYVFCHLELAKKYLTEEKYQKAISLLNEAKKYPRNLGEGKLPIAKENNINYYLGCAYEGLGEKDKSIKFFKEATIGSDEPTDMMFYNDQPADLIFYQGLALRKLGREGEARGRFNKLYDYGEKHLSDEMKIDYFAVSLPDFLIFDADLNVKNKVHCHYLMGLGLLGLGDKKGAKEELKKAYSLNKYHQGVLTHLKMVNQTTN